MEFRRRIPSIEDTACADPDFFFIGGPILTTFCIVDEGREYPNTTKMGHHRPASEMLFKRCFAGGPMMADH